MEYFVWDYWGFNFLQQLFGESILIKIDSVVIREREELFCIYLSNAPIGKQVPFDFVEMFPRILVFHEHLLFDYLWEMFYYDLGHGNYIYFRFSSELIGEKFPVGNYMFEDSAGRGKFYIYMLNEKEGWAVFSPKETINYQFYKPVKLNVSNWRILY